MHAPLAIQPMNLVERQKFCVKAMVSGICESTECDQILKYCMGDYMIYDLTRLDAARSGMCNQINEKLEPLREQGYDFLPNSIIFINLSEFEQIFNVNKIGFNFTWLAIQAFLKYRKG
ncbi:unnamed protein product [Paramecium pentaurelia]|uniref:Uncharacterized protein n=1 Tax=Paramecium pentaurelia TaxID=43138 RepID=A0A8S1Y2J1_9CILI|nr:unnamed protein product [Paramecium pentaurelia]